MADRVGQQLGNYRLMRLLGQGGFAEVYLGEQVYLNSQAAIKILYTHLAQEDAARFLSEARTLVHLVHPHIVRLLDFGVEGTTPFLVMDYAPGGTLRQRHPRGERLPLATIVDYVNQVADALQYAHDEKLIHRDIKPENMLLGRRNEILLSDFGIAVVAQSSRYDRTQDTTGTIAYMAPEQIQAHPRPASDQYALGIVVYEWLCGDRPFGGSFTEIAAKHVLVPPPPLRQKLPTLAPEVEEVVMSALAKDPHQRFASVQAFATALRQASQLATVQRVPQRWTPPQPADAPTMLSQAQQPTELVSRPSESFIPTQLVTPASQLPISTEPSTSPVQPSTPKEIPTPSTHPALPPTELAAPASQAASPPPQVAPPMSQPPLPLAPAPSSRPPAEVPGVLIPREPAKAKRGISRRTVIVGLGLTGLAVACGGINWWVLKPRLLYTYWGHSPFAVTAVAWSLDGRRIASGSLDKTVQVWDAADGGHVFTYRGHSDSVEAVAWSPDGKRIASGGDDKTVQVWDAFNGGNVYTYRGHSRAVSAVAWSPDGRRIASASQDKTVQVWDAANGGNVYTYRGHSYFVSAVAWSPDGRRITSGSGNFYNRNDDHTVQVWDAANGGHVYTYRGPSAAVNTVAWSPDGRRIASGSEDNTVQVWDAANGGHVYTYRGHSRGVNAVAWSPDGKRIASAGGYDYTVQVWVAG
jgi:serine/threonine protein kinase